MILRNSGAHSLALCLGLGWILSVFTPAQGSVFSPPTAETSHPDSLRFMQADSIAFEVERLSDKGLYVKAADLAEQDLQIRREILGEKHLEVAQSMHRLAVLLTKIGSYDQAEHMLRASLRIRHEQLGPTHPDVAQSIRSLGCLHLERSQCTRAENRLREALTLYEQLYGEEHAAVAACLHDLSDVYFQRGDLAEADLLVQRSMAIYSKLQGPNYAERANLLASVAHIREHQQNWADAESYCREALRLGQERYGEEHPIVADLWDALGNVLLVVGTDIDETDECLTNALTIRRNAVGHMNPDDGTTLLRLSTVAGRRGDDEKAYSLLQEAVAKNLHFYGENHPRVARSYVWVASYHRFQGRHDLAAEYFRRALDIDIRVTGSHFYVPKLLSHLAECLLAQEKVTEAESTLAQGISAFEEARLHVGSEFRRAARGSPYTPLAATRLMLGKHEEAWPAAERGLGGTISDLILAADQRFLSPGESVREDTLTGRLNRLETELASLEWAAQSDSSERTLDVVAAKRTELLDARVEWRSFRLEMAAKNPVAVGQAFSLDRVQESLTEETAIIGWVHMNFSFSKPHDESVTWGYVVRSSGPVRWVQLESTLEDDSAGSLEPNARDFRKTLVAAASWPVRLRGTDIVARQAHDVWRGWVAPLTPHLGGVTHLVVLPPRYLFGVPIEILSDSGGVCLGDRYSVSYAPSATIYAWLQEQGRGKKSNAPVSALLVGAPLDTEEDASGMGRDGNRSGGLKDARAEILRIASLVPGAEVLLGRDASERKIRTMAETGELRRFDLIHIATHAFVDEEHPERSALMLSQVDKSDPINVIMTGEPAFDGFLTAEEIVRQFEFDPRLIVLGACRTTMANAPGDGFLDLSYAFLLSGAQSVMVSLWNVSDDATSMLMGRFYENLIGAYTEDRGAGSPATPMDKAGALKEAKLWVRNWKDDAGDRPFEHPVYWAGFVLIGGLN